MWVQAYIMKSKKSGRVSNDSSDAISKSQTETNQIPKQANYTQSNKALQHGRDHILVAHHSTIKERKPRRHKKYKCGGNKHPGGVSFIDAVRHILYGLFSSKQNQ